MSLLLSSTSVSPARRRSPLPALIPASGSVSVASESSPRLSPAAMSKAVSPLETLMLLVAEIRAEASPSVSTTMAPFAAANTPLNRKLISPPACVIDALLSWPVSDSSMGVPVPARRSVMSPIWLAAVRDA